MKTEIIKLYPERNDVTLTSYIWTNSGELMGDRKRPAVVVCPGGAWIWCSDREAEPVALRFAAMGYNAFVLKYSVYFGNGMVDFDFTKLKPKPEVVYPAAIRDIGKAILCIKEHAGEWNIDINKIIVTGGSADGHLSALYATSWHKPVLSDYFKVPAEQFRPAAAVCFYPVADFIENYKAIASRTNQQTAGLEAMAYMSLFGTFTPSEELMREASPAFQVSEKTPPMFIWTTSEDELVQSRQSMLLGIALAEKKIPYELHIFEEGGHGLSLAHQASAGAKNQINADVARWVELAEAWLMKRFALDLPNEPPQATDIARSKV
jgi:acetyl esterase/lipase